VQPCLCEVGDSENNAPHFIYRKIHGSSVNVLEVLENNLVVTGGEEGFIRIYDTSVRFDLLGS
jgi:hypothetical protein